MNMIPIVKRSASKIKNILQGGEKQEKPFFRKGASNIVMTAMPKSASSYFRDNFGKYFEPTHAVVRGKAFNGYGNNFLSRERLISRMPEHKSIAIYGHYQMNKYHNNLLSEVCPDKKAIVIIRSLPDLMVSHYDHIEKYSRGPMDMDLLKMPETNSLWQTLTEKQRYDFLIKYTLSWYITFINSWILAQQLGWNVRLVKFENHTRNIEKELMQLNEALNFSSVELNQDYTVEEKVHLNVGVSGRGLQKLSSEQINDIQEALDLMLSDAALKSYLIGETDVEFSNVPDTP